MNQNSANGAKQEQKEEVRINKMESKRPVNEANALAYYILLIYVLCMYYWISLYFHATTLIRMTNIFQNIKK